MNWSHFQRDIFEAFERSRDSLLIEAVAGSGKTSTLVELANIMQRAFPQQRAVIVAFNKSIAVELQARITARNVQAMTLHSAGWAAWRRAGGLDWEPSVDSMKTSKIMREVLSWEENKKFGETTRRLVGYAKGAGIVPRGSVNNAYPVADSQGIPILEMHGLVDDTPEAWEALIDHYGLDEDACDIGLVRKVLARSIELARETCDFDDMLYMPVVAGVPFDRYDVVLVDEAQDVSAIQRTMIERMAGDGRVVACGDRRQSIFGFRGAGTNSMDELKEHFQMKELPLSVSYRCPVAVVEWARQWVPQIEARDGAPDGVVLLEGTDWTGQAEVALGAPLDTKPRFASAYGVSPEKYREMAGDVEMSVEEAEGLLDTFNKAFPKVLKGGDQGIASTSAPLGHGEPAMAEGITKWRGLSDFRPGDAILCRLTRPLVAAAFTLIRARIAGVHVLGRDIGKGITDLVKKSKQAFIRDLLSWLDRYQLREGSRLRKRGKHAQAGLLDDRCETLRVFCWELPDDGRVEEVERLVGSLFTDPNGGGQARIITLSTVHKFKGMEADRVFVLDAGELMPCPWAKGGGWEMQQEWNLCYVAATRAKRELRYIKTSDLKGDSL